MIVAPPKYFQIPREALKASLEGNRRQRCNTFLEVKLSPELVARSQFRVTSYIPVAESFDEAIAYRDGFCFDWVIHTSKGWRVATFPEVFWIECRVAI